MFNWIWNFNMICLNWLFFFQTFWQLNSAPTYYGIFSIINGELILYLASYFKIGTLYALYFLIFLSLLLNKPFCFLWSLYNFYICKHGFNFHYNWLFKLMHIFQHITNAHGLLIWTIKSSAKPASLCIKSTFNNRL